jgi:hypothetical protein
VSLCLGSIYRLYKRKNIPLLKSISRPVEGFMSVQKERGLSTGAYDNERPVTRESNSSRSSWDIADSFDHVMALSMASISDIRRLMFFLLSENHSSLKLQTPYVSFVNQVTHYVESGLRDVISTVSDYLRSMYII